MLVKRLLEDLDFLYVLTYKYSQDHLELLFSCIRSRGGNNNNPNVKDINQTSVLQHLNKRRNLKKSKINIRNIIYNSSSTYYKDNIFHYVSGFIVRKICSKVTCEECRTQLLDDSCWPTIDLSS